MCIIEFLALTARQIAPGFAFGCEAVTREMRRWRCQVYQCARYGSSLLNVETPQGFLSNNIGWATNDRSVTSFPG